MQGGAVVFDAAWADFSEFKLSEIFVNGDQLIETSFNYKDIFALAAGYSRPVPDRPRIGFGAIFLEVGLSFSARSVS
jgi:hypothetical protein